MTGNTIVISYILYSFSPFINYSFFKRRLIAFIKSVLSLPTGLSHGREWITRGTVRVSSLNSRKQTERAPMHQRVTEHTRNSRSSEENQQPLIIPQGWSAPEIARSIRDSFSLSSWIHSQWNDIVERSSTAPWEVMLIPTPRTRQHTRRLYIPSIYKMK